MILTFSFIVEITATIYGWLQLISQTFTLFIELIKV
jgi:hypothetical protein